MRNIWVLKFGLISCAGVVPLALICAPLRHIPLWWIAVDSSFGIIGAIPLYAAYRLTHRLETDQLSAHAVSRSAERRSGGPTQKILVTRRREQVTRLDTKLLGEGEAHQRFTAAAIGWPGNDGHVREQARPRLPRAPRTCA